MSNNILPFRPVYKLATPVPAPPPNGWGEGSRLHRIRESLTKINRLMTELKAMSDTATDTDNTTQETAI